VDETVLRKSLTSLAPISAPRLDPKAGVAVSLEKSVIRWVLGHPDAVTVDELEEWAEEFDNPELKGLMGLIIQSYREHGRVDHVLLVQQAIGETQRQRICALTLEGDKSDNPAGDFLAAEWRRSLKVRQLKKARARLKAQLAKVSGGDDLVALQVQWREIHQQLAALAAI
jgi:hypothetical protein